MVNVKYSDLEQYHKVPIVLLFVYYSEIIKYINIQSLTYGMEKTVEEDISEFEEESSISQSVENLSDLSQKVKSIKNRKRENLDESENKISEHESYFTGVIVPGPDDEDTKTGEICGGEVCVWVKNKKTGDQFSEWLNYPTSESKYDKSNEYIRLCKYLGIRTDNPEDMLYQEVPVYKEYSGLNGELHLPENGSQTSVIKHKFSRKANSLVNKAKNTGSLMVAINLAIYSLFIRYILISFPSFVPKSGSESAALGYSYAEGFAIFFVFSIIMFIIFALNIKLSFEYIPQFIENVYNKILSKINKSLESEYIE